MPKALTLELGLIAPRTTRVESGWEIPWEVSGYAEDAAASRAGGVFDLTHYRTLSLSGPDARDYLQRMSTVDFKTFRGNRAELGGFLNGKAGVIALGVFLAADGAIHFVLPPERALTARAHLEQFHFREELSIEDRSDEWAVLGLWAPPTALTKELGIDPLAAPQEIHSAPGHFTWWRDDSRVALVWVRMKRDQAKAWLERVRARGVSFLGQRLFDFHRLGAGVPEAGREVSERDILLEGSGERFVARDKGCYPGQEVIERIFTYGQVNRRLLVVLGGPAPGGSGPWPLSLGGKEAGQLVAWEAEPGAPGQGVGLAYVKRAYWDDGGTLTADGWSGRIRR